MGPVYAVGGSVRDHILGRHCHDHDYVVPGDAGVFARKVADTLGAKVFTLGSGDKANHRMVWGRDTFDFTAMAGETIHDDLKRRDFTINALAYDMKAAKLVDPLGGTQDIGSKTIRLVSPEAIAADPLRMLRAFRFAAVLHFEIEPRTCDAIAGQRGLISTVAGERIRSEFYQIMAQMHSSAVMKHMAQAGLLTEIFPELAPTMGCGQNDIHGQDVFHHTLGVFSRLEDILADCDSIWPRYASLIRAYLDMDSRRILLKWSALFHDLGKPACRQIDAAGKVRFIGHEKESRRLGHRICSRLKMSNRDRAFITHIVVEHLKPLLLFNAGKKGHLTSRGLFRFIRKHNEHVIGVLIHGFADQQGKAGGGENLVREFKAFTDEVFDMYFSKIKPRLQTPRLVTGNDVMTHFGLAPSRLIGKVLERLDEAQLRGHITTKSDALNAAARFIELEGDAGIEPATPSSGGLCSIR